MQNSERKASRLSCTYLKLYMPEELQDEFLVQVVRPHSEAFLDNERPSKFFFIRYSDPMPHIRLRYFLKWDAKVEKRQSSLIRFYREQCDKHQIPLVKARYRPEWDRYGGRLGMFLAESLFMSSSKTVLDFLTARSRGASMSKAEFALATFEFMLQSLEFNLEQRQNFFKRYYYEQSHLAATRHDKKDLFAEYSNRLRPALERIVFDTEAYQAKQDLPIAAIFETFKTEHTQIFQLLKQNRRRLSDSIENMVRSYIHMHLNRLAFFPVYERVLEYARSEITGMSAPTNSI